MIVLRKYSAIVALTLFLLPKLTSASSYSVVERFKILEDRILIDQHISENLLTEGVFGRLTTSGESLLHIQDLSELNDQEVDSLLSKENLNQEFTAHTSWNLIYSLKKYEFTEFLISPKLYLKYDFGFVSGIQKREMSQNEFNSFVLSNYTNSEDRKIIREILDALAFLPSAGENIFQHFINQGLCSSAAILTFCNEKQAAANPLLMPGNSDEKLFYYAKSELKTGLLFDFEINDDWKGYFNLYMLYRGDNLLVVDENTAVNDNRSLLSKSFVPANGQYFFMLDTKFQIRLRPVLIQFLMEELKVTRWKENIEDEGDLSYGSATLYQLNVYYPMIYAQMHIDPFLGYHKRRGYDFTDGIYAGVDIKNRRTYSALRLMLDSEYFKLSPRITVGSYKLNYVLQIPLSTEVDNTGVEQSMLHTFALNKLF